ncbi:EAL domain-containing protein [Sphingomonas sp.]|jgi:EAL domain-containing protein (putative c-di-GMP-specific phosphodiesterase class I)|uniref:EAL domain-containing protein n=1 Tax=Sphingomonas sp. TaxID=28214 RepID=UPI002ED96C17
MKDAPSPLSLSDASHPATAKPDDTVLWCALAVAVIANYQVLRRHLGRPGAAHAIGAVANRLAEAFPELVPAVVGHDRIELTFRPAGYGALHTMLARIDAACQSPFSIDGEEHRIELLLGASATPAGAGDELRLIEEAEHALEDARIERHPVLRALPGTASVDRIALKRDLAGAIAGGALFLQYQPKVHLRRQEVVGVEALVRWRHPTRGLIPPGDFIPIAEESRDIVALTLWTLHQVIADQRRLAAMGHEQIMFINVAGALLGDVRFVRAVREIVPASGARLGFEITETSVIRDPESAIANLKTFADLGIILAIDDYGAGLSSLAYLKQLPARELKIDKMFVTQLTSSNRDPLIVRSTIDLAHALDMEVVAEGVETPAALALLSVMGCDMAQGFFISRPVAIEALVTFLREYRPKASGKFPVPFASLGANRGRG